MDVMAQEHCCGVVVSAVAIVTDMEEYVMSCVMIVAVEAGGDVTASPVTISS